MATVGFKGLIGRNRNNTTTYCSYPLEV